MLAVVVGLVAVAAVPQPFAESAKCEAFHTSSSEGAICLRISSAHLE